MLHALELKTQLQFHSNWKSSNMSLDCGKRQLLVETVFTANDSVGL